MFKETSTKPRQKTFCQLKRVTYANFRYKHSFSLKLQLATAKKQIPLTALQISANSLNQRKSQRLRIPLATTLKSLNQNPEKTEFDRQSANVKNL
jgi:hypothetical protein